MNDLIREIFGRLGISEVGFCPFEAVADRLLPCRAKERLPEHPQSILLCLFPYKVKEERPHHISRYAAVPDYHGVCGRYLEKAAAALQAAFPQNQFIWFLDNSPIPEVYAAACAGLGLAGENGLLINHRFGSWCFIGEVVTDLAVPCQNKPEKCPSCGDCKKACPRGDYGTDCLSAVSQQKRALTLAEETALRENGLIWGCDLCAEACPLNRGVELAPLPEFVAGYREDYREGETIEGRAYAWRGEKPVRRNAAIVSGKEKAT